MSRGSLLEHFLRLVDLCREVRASAAIGVVEKHQVAMRLADLVAAETALPMTHVVLAFRGPGTQHLRARQLDVRGSRWLTGETE